MLFDYLHSFNHLPVPLTGELLEQLLDAPWLHQLCEEIAAGDKNKKKRLPAVTWQAHFNGNERSNRHAIPSGLFQLDIDHCQPDEVWDKIQLRIEELGIYVVHKTASCEGIRVVARCRKEFQSLSENQLWLAEQLGVKPDMACKDFARLGFLCERSYVYYYNPAIFSDEPSQLLVNSAAEPTPTASSVEPAPHLSPRDLAFRGVPYSEIVSELINRTGGEPYEGERNNRLYLICRLLANITDRQVERLFQVCPRFGLSEAEVRACCESACKSSRTEKLPYVLYKVLRDLGIHPDQAIAKEGEEETSTEVPLALTLPESSHLPPLIREFVETSPQDFKTATAMACLPVCGFLGSRLRARYLDGDLQAPSFIVNIVAPAASGKGSLLRIPDICLEKIRQKDEEGREIEAEYNRQCKLKKNDKKQLEEPQCIIRDVPAKISVAQLLRRMVKAKGLHLISISPEADTLTNSNKAGVWAQKSDIYRIAQDADGGRYGQDYSSETSFSAVVQVRYNLLTLGTPGAIARAYPDTEDGLLTRCIIVPLPSQFGKQMPTRVQLNARQQRIIQEKVNALMAISQDEQENVLPEHHLKLSWLLTGIEGWIHQQRIRSVRDDDHARDQFMRRAALIGFRAGMVAAFLWKNCNKKRQAYTIEFAQWVSDFILESLLERYAQTVNEQALSYETPKSNRYPSLFDAMPDLFELSHLRKACITQGCKSPLKSIIFRWTENGLIEKQGETYVKLVK